MLHIRDNAHPPTANLQNNPEGLESDSIHSKINKCYTQNMRNDFIYYQQLFVDMAENPKVVSASDLLDVEEASMEERGRLAVYLLSELNVCWGVMKAGRKNRNARQLTLSLMNSLTNSSVFSYDDFAYVVDNASLHPLFCVLSNECCPVAFLIDYVYPQLTSYRSDELQFAGVSFKSLLDDIRGKRISEIATLLREKTPELETLNDDMVLGVSGVTFSRS